MRALLRLLGTAAMVMAGGTPGAAADRPAHHTDDGFQNVPHSRTVNRHRLLTKNVLARFDGRAQLSWTEMRWRA